MHNAISPMGSAAMFAELEAIWTRAATAWMATHFSAARSEYGQVLTMAEIPPQYQSYARLRIAQSYQAEGNTATAKAAYALIAADTACPEVHRSEAAECIREIDRQAQGLPARDAAASRTKIAPVAPAREFFVAPDGSDAHPGTAAQPFATLNKARDAVRALKANGLPAGGVAITLKRGEYPVRETLALMSEDSGTPESPIIYRSETIGASTLYGGVRLSGFTPVVDPAVLARLPEEARGHICQCDLRSLGITDYGELKVRGFGLQRTPPPTLELYCNGQPQILARWPNEGFVGIDRLVAPGNAETGEPSVIGYLGGRPERWTRAEEPWLFGYFKYLWADSSIKVGAIDTAAKTLTTAEPYDYSGGMDTGQGIIYYAYNLLEELDQPGEWYLNRETGILYFWPPVDPAAATIEIGMWAAPMLTMTGVSHVRVESLVFDLARENGLILTDCEHCLIAGCTISRFAGNGITVNGGHGNGLYGCDVHTVGRRAAEVLGGERESLTPGGHFVENCRLYNYGRIDRTYTPAIQLEGVGNRVAHNLMYDGPSSVMRIEGNDHVIEYNEVHSVVRESDDQGAIDIFLNPTYRGLIFRHNYFHDNGKTGAEHGVHGQAAIRLDDAISGVQIYGNVFVRSSNGNFGAVQMNSGRDNVIDNNIFADCHWGISGGWYPGNSVWQGIRNDDAPADFYTTPLYRSRYPAIAWMMEAPGCNFLWRNIFFNCGAERKPHGSDVDALANGVYRHTDPGFADAAGDNYTLAPDTSPITRLGFRPIPFEDIGLYADACRASWPVQTTPVAIPDWRQNVTCIRPDIRGDAEISSTWHVFAPLPPAFPPPTGEQLLGIPASLIVNGQSLTPVPVVVEDGRLDLAELLHGTAPEKEAWLYIPFTTCAGGETTLGLGADWWLQAWVDGARICDTLPDGNGAYPPTGMDHLVTLSLAPGAHLLVVRFISGSNSSQFAVAGPAAIVRLWDEEHWWTVAQGGCAATKHKTVLVGEKSRISNAGGDPT